MIRKSFNTCHLLLVVLLLLKGLFGSAEGQERTEGCQKINKGLDVIFIQFEETRAPENKGKQDEAVYFRIRNNTTCEVWLSSPDSPLRRLNAEWTNAVEDGEKARVLYEVETKSGRLQHYKQDHLFVISLLPGRSCIFPVLSSYLKKTNVICVPYRYAWEDSAVGVSTPRCEVRFFARDLPRGWGKRKE